MHASLRALALAPLALSVAASSALAPACDDTTSSGVTVPDDVFAPDAPGASDAPGAPDASGPDGAGSSAACGDGTCDPGETVFSCRADCDPTDTALCLATGCQDALDACVALTSCVAALDCVVACDGDTSCQEACQDLDDLATGFVLGELVACAEGEGCLEAPAALDSCVDRCGDNDPGAECQCDSGCQIFDDCCPDFVAVCIEGGAPPAGGVCGDGTCDEDEDASTCPQDCDDVPPVEGCGDGVCQPDETPESCPADCTSAPDSCGDGECDPATENPVICPQDCDGSDDPAIQCLETQCTESWGVCTASAPCLSGLECILACDSEGCAQGCFEAIPPAAAQALLSVLQCFQAECGEGGPDEPECGDGVCEDGENPVLCPEDCEGGPPPSGFIGCLESTCTSEIAECLAGDACAAVWQCILDDCADDPTFSCTIGCGQAGGFGSGIISLGICVQQSGCLEG